MVSPLILDLSPSADRAFRSIVLLLEFQIGRTTAIRLWACLDRVFSPKGLNVCRKSEGGI